MCNGGIDLPDVGPWLEKTLEERPYVRTVSLQRLVLVCLCVCVWVGGKGGEVILTGKSQRENTIWWHRL